MADARIGIDVGGTFTDLVLIDGGGSTTFSRFLWASKNCLMRIRRNVSKRFLLIRSPVEKLKA